MSTSTKDAFGREKIQCLECNEWYHQLSVHLASKHTLSVAVYSQKHPGAPTMSETARASMVDGQKRRGTPEPEGSPVEKTVEPPPVDAPTRFRFGVATLEMRYSLGAEELKMVPPHDDNYTIGDGLLEQLALGIEQGDNTLLVGPTGCGKTTLVYELAAITSEPVVRVNMHGDIRAADFVGEKVVEVDAATGQAVVMWKDGLLPRAVKNGWWLILDELDACPPAIMFILQSLLEETRQLTLTGDHGRIMTAHPKFRIIATANTIGRGDDTGLYTGTNILNEATLDRFGTVIKFDYLPAAEEAKVLVAKTKIAGVTAQKLVEVAGLVRKGFAAEECFCTFSTRRLLRWASKTVRLGGRIREAAKVTVLNKLTADDEKYVGAIIQRVTGA